VDPAREAGDPYAKQDGPDPARVAAGRKAARTRARNAAKDE
jgi:hypothetical protein